MSAVLSPKQPAAGAEDNTIRAFTYRASQSELDEQETVSDVQ